MSINKLYYIKFKPTRLALLILVLIISSLNSNILNCKSIKKKANRNNLNSIIVNDNITMILIEIYSNKFFVDFENDKQIVISDKAAKLLIVDPEKKRCGFDATDDKKYKEILGATYSDEYSENSYCYYQEILINEVRHGKYLLLIKGLEDDSYKLDISIRDTVGRSFKRSYTKEIKNEKYHEYFIDIPSIKEMDAEITTKSIKFYEISINK
jgi:hypothetical protein